MTNYVFLSDGGLLSSIDFSLQLDLIVESDTGMASSTDVLNLTSHIKEKISKEEAQSILRRLIKEKWLTEVC